jgi:sialate O-acetylesterase
MATIVPRSGAVTPGGLFADHMVLQRQMPVPVWGTGAPGEAITVRFAGQSKGTTADGKGQWRVRLDPMEAQAKPAELTIQGAETRVIQDVLVGDVWLCSGQSNMVFSLTEVPDAKAEVADANRPLIRLSMGSGWLPCSPENVAKGGWKGFSAVGYYFGRKLNDDLKVPIGLIQCAASGTMAEPWTGEQALRKHLPELNATLDMVNRARAGEDVFAQWFAANDPGSANGALWAAPSFDDSQWQQRLLPDVFETTQFGDLWGKFAGALWFRSEFDLAAVDGEMTLSLNSIDSATVWINGVAVAEHQEPGKPRSYVIPAATLKAGKNTIALRFMHANTTVLPGVTGPADQFTLGGATGGAKSLAGPWKYHAGGAATAAAPPPQSLGGGTPGQLFNTMIVPLAPFAMKGALWYQGEANIDRAARYQQLLPALIESWRTLWGQSEFAFYIVQLPNYGERTTLAVDPVGWQQCWAELREAQRLTALKTPGCGVAVTIDQGEAKDIHPPRKKEVGRRLALLALAKTYHLRGVCTGPAYQAMKVDGNSIRLRFDLGGGKLASRDNAPLTGFVIAGADQKWVCAEAKIDGATVRVSSPEVTAPVAVRYAWAGNPDCNLINNNGLPASPFRTDDWPLVTAGK